MYIHFYRLITVTNKFQSTIHMLFNIPLRTLRLLSNYEGRSLVVTSGSCIPSLLAFFLIPPAEEIANEMRMSNCVRSSSNIDPPSNTRSDNEPHPPYRAPDDRCPVLLEEESIRALELQHSIRELRQTRWICRIIAILLEALGAEFGTGNCWGKLHPPPVHRGALQTLGPIGIWRVRIWPEATDSICMNLV